MAAGFLLVCLLAAPDTEALALEYLRAEPLRRQAILEELEPVDVITAADVAAWRAKLLKAASKGTKLRKRGRNYFYDKKEKRGKYIVGGSGGRGGLLIGLHGGGKGAGDAGSAASTFAGIASKFKCIGIFPEVLEKTEHGWTTSGTEQFVLELIEAAKRTWKIDPNRVYIVGHSMGGYGSWTIGAHHADLFAGLGPFAGGPTPITEDGKPYGKVLAIEDGVLPCVRNVALHIYQSLDDKNVPPGPNVFANKELMKWKKEYGGYNYKYVEVDKRGHGAPPGGHIVGLNRLHQIPRNPRPKRILWQPILSYKRMFYWIWWDKPVPRILVEVKITKPNEIDVDLDGHARVGFRIFLDERLVDLSKEVVVREGGDVVFRGKVPYTLSSMLMTAAEKYDAEMLFPARIDLK
ncbi:MAG: alpha/beta hydrolase-fold protein [Planctomycetota bacterium]|nr:alpha/beta hydrolase-fold protein [Planctomycetota bacterium]